jgi:hypothetical protein
MCVLGIGRQSAGTIDEILGTEDIFSRWRRVVWWACECASVPSSVRSLQLCDDCAQAATSYPVQWM